MSDATMVGEEPDLSADAFVGRIFEATVGGFDLLSVVIGDRLGLYTSLARDGSATSGELATRSRDRRAVCAGVARTTGRHWHPHRRRRRGRPGPASVHAPVRSRRGAHRSRKPLLHRAARALLRGLCRGAAAAPRCIPLGWRCRVVRLRPRHDRGPGRFQPAVARELVRLGLPAGRPGRPRTVDRRSAGTRRRCRLRRRVGLDRHRPRLSERAGRRLRPRSALDRSRACERGCRRRRRSGDVRDARRRATRPRPADTTWRS